MYDYTIEYITKFRKALLNKLKRASCKKKRNSEN
jgi:hypothetical protein